MTNQYRWVAWNRHKKVSDLVVAGSIVVFLAAFVGVGLAFPASGVAQPDTTLMPVLIRALGACALVLLHVILCIGPLSRLTHRVSPVLYNRRHLGVMMFLVALGHAALSTLYYGAFGDNPNALEQVLLAQRSFTSLAAFPYELLGFIALLWLFLMASTSHDYWLHTLSPGVWKTLHMGVYVAYALLLGHVALGSMRDDATLVTPALLLAGALTVGGLHALAGVREAAKDSAGSREGDAAIDPERSTDDGTPWVRACDIDDIAESRAKVVCLAARERVAIFRHQGKLSAVSNVCAHQAGPLGEGKIVDGCITCPWHGYQYLPHNGQSPPPYTEKIPTYRLRIQGRDVFVDPRPLPPGTPVEPIFVGASPGDEQLFEDVSKAPITRHRDDDTVDLDVNAPTSI